MVVWIRLFGYLNNCLKRLSKQNRDFEIEIMENSTIENLLKQLGIPPRELILVINPGERERILIIDGKKMDWKGVILQKNDRIWIYPFLDGG